MCVHKPIRTADSLKIKSDDGMPNFVHQDSVLATDWSNIQSEQSYGHLPSNERQIEREERPSDNLVMLAR